MTPKEARKWQAAIQRELEAFAWLERSEVVHGLLQCMSNRNTVDGWVNLIEENLAAAKYTTKPTELREALQAIAAAAIAACCEMATIRGA